ncbi:MAG TPA: hypothetical protein PLP57_07370 [Candidatus Saccharicenans sp.]|nr:hypothetical protein [Candidatus Saccharicenans sp.]HRD02445.1 hypothetical protein [Candidatus Saccharicenans sp.]
MGANVKGVKVKKILAAAGLILLVIIVIGLGVRTFLNYRHGKKLERYLAELKASGRLVDISKLASPCRDVDNGALWWKAAESLFILEQGDKASLALASDFSDWNPFSSEDEIQLKALIDRNRKVIELMLEASTRPCFRYGDLQKPVLERQLPDFSLMIQATRLLIIDALFKGEAEQIDKALDEMLQGLAFARLCCDEPLLINFQISMANARLLLYNLNRLMSEAKAPVPTPALINIMKALDSETWRKAMTRALKAEHGGFCFGTYELVQKGELLPDINPVGWRGRLANWWKRPALKSEVIWVSEQYQKMIEAAELPFYKSEKEMILGGGKDIPSKYKLARLILPRIYAVVVKEATLEAMIDAARIGLGCLIYRNQYGKYPEKISDLLPDILKEEPLDPFTGQSLIYRTKEDGFIVYSLGTNQKDDNGKMSEMTQLVMDKDDDWSWRQNW